MGFRFSERVLKGFVEHVVSASPPPNKRPAINTVSFMRSLSGTDGKFVATYEFQVPMVATNVLGLIA